MIQLDYEPTSKPHRPWWLRLLRWIFITRPLMLDGSFDDLTPADLAEIRRLIDQLKERHDHDRHV